MGRSPGTQDRGGCGLIFENCVALLGESLQPYFCPVFETSGDRIVRIESTGPPLTRLPEGGLILVPGLVNGHTHFGDACLMDGATGLTLEEGFFRPHGFKYRELARLDRATQVACLCDTLRYAAASGTVAHFDFREQGPDGARRLREASRATGVYSVILGQFDQVPFDQSALVANRAELPEIARLELEEILDEADGFSESTMNDLTDPAWCQIRTITARQGKARAIHCLENAAYRETSLQLTGVGDLARALSLYHPDLIVHLTVADDEEIRMLAESGVTAVINPRANANLGLPLPPVAKLLEAGVNLVIGTDNGLLNSPNLWAELDFTYKLAKSQYGDALRPDPAAILAMATSNVGKSRWGDILPGTLTEGGPATLVAVDFRATHLRRSAHILASLLTRVTPEDVVLTLFQGKTLHQSPHFPS
jgi:cytosine/adenosine deaminase-related metal-dependent hydrolase